MGLHFRHQIQDYPYITVTIDGSLIGRDQLYQMVKGFLNNCKILMETKILKVLKSIQRKKKQELQHGKPQNRRLLIRMKLHPCTLTFTDRHVVKFIII